MLGSCKVTFLLCSMLSLTGEMASHAMASFSITSDGEGARELLSRYISSHFLSACIQRSVHQTSISDGIPTCRRHPEQASAKEAIPMTQLAETEESIALGPCGLEMKELSLFERHLHPHMRLGFGHVGIHLRPVPQT